MCEKELSLWLEEARKKNKILERLVEIYAEIDTFLEAPFLYGKANKLRRSGWEATCMYHNKLGSNDRNEWTGEKTYTGTDIRILNLPYYLYRRLENEGSHFTCKSILGINDEKKPFPEEYYQESSPCEVEHKVFLKELFHHDFL